MKLHDHSMWYEKRSKRDWLRKVVKLGLVGLLLSFGVLAASEATGQEPLSQATIPNMETAPIQVIPPVNMPGGQLLLPPLELYRDPAEVSPFAKPPETPKSVVPWLDSPFDPPLELAPAMDIDPVVGVPDLRSLRYKAERARMKRHILDRIERLERMQERVRRATDTLEANRDLVAQEREKKLEQLRSIETDITKLMGRYERFLLAIDR